MFIFPAILFRFMLFTLYEMYYEIALPYFLTDVELVLFLSWIASEQYGHEAYLLQKSATTSIR